MKSLAHQFLDFCRSKPAAEEYNYWSTNACAVSQFGNEIGYLPVGRCLAASPEIHGLHDRFAHTVYAKPQTFGALASRLATELSA
jgi:hypothetical protein